MIRLCIIITGLDTGGAETSVFRLLERMDRALFDIHVISLSTKGAVGDRIEGLGIPVIAIGMSPGIAALRSFPRLIRMLRSIQPDVVHTVMYHADFAGGVAARLAGIRRVVWGVHHANLSPRHNKIFTLVAVYICSLLSRCVPDRIILCSERGRELHTSIGYDPSRMVVIPNGYDLQRFKPDGRARRSVRAELGLTYETTLVGLIARDDPLKNLTGFVTAAAWVNAVIPNVHFLLAGQGIDANNCVLVEAIAGAGLDGIFHLLGTRNDIPRLMASLDVLALSSHGEAFPNVLGEAMACGIPCVSTRAGDAADIIGDTGGLAPLGDMELLAERMIEILQLPPDARRALGARARARVRECYSLKNIVRRYENTLRDFAN